MTNIQLCASMFAFGFSIGIVMAVLVQTFHAVTRAAQIGFE